MGKKKDKKKILVLGLLLFAVVGLAGYGVYSYYFTRGSFDTESASDEDSDNVIRITGEFEPIFDGGASSSYFIGQGGSFELYCPRETSGNETIRCTASPSVVNEGTTSIRVEVYDGSSSVSTQSGDDYVTAGNPSFDWYNNTAIIGPGESKTLNISVDVYVGDRSMSGDGVEVNEPVYSDELSANTTFKIKATQINN